MAVRSTPSPRTVSGWDSVGSMFDGKFRTPVDRAVKPMDYPDKLTLMEWFPVTSLMTTPQLSQYLEKVQDHYRGRVALEFPETDTVRREAA